MTNASDSHVRQVVGDLKLCVGDLRLTRLGRVGIRVELGPESADGEMCAALIPLPMVEAVGQLPAAERVLLLDWLGIDGHEAPAYTPGLLSARLRAMFGYTKTLRGNQSRIATAMGRRVMTICRWSTGYCLPTEEEARRLASVCGWDEGEVIADLRFELAQRAIRRSDRRSERARVTAGPCTVVNLPG